MGCIFFVSASLPADRGRGRYGNCWIRGGWGACVPLGRMPSHSSNNTALCPCFWSRRRGRPLPPRGRGYSCSRNVGVAFMFKQVVFFPFCSVGHEDSCQGKCEKMERCVRKRYPRPALPGSAAAASRLTCFWVNQIFGRRVDVEATHPPPSGLRATEIVAKENVRR